MSVGIEMVEPKIFTRDGSVVRSLDFIHPPRRQRATIHSPALTHADFFVKKRKKGRKGNIITMVTLAFLIIAIASLLFKI